MDEAVDDALQELLAALRAEDPYELPVVFMSWYRRVSSRCDERLSDRAKSAFILVR